MTHHQTHLPASLKVFLFGAATFFALAAVLLIFFRGSAATIAGSSPSLALSLVSGPNTGLLRPGEERWFRLTTAQAAFVPQTLSLIFTPDNGQRVNRVAMQLFQEEELAWYYLGHSAQMANLGAGQIVVRDQNPETGQLLWAGWLPGEKSYYLQLQNGNDITIDYWLFPADVADYPLGEAASPVVAAAPPAAPNPPAIAAAPAPPPAASIDPGLPAPLPPDVAHNRLAPHTTHWYSLDPANFAGQDHFKEANLSLFVTPGDSGAAQQVKLNLFPAGAVEAWQRGEVNQPVNFGAGSPVSRDGDPLTSEQLWRGVLLQGELYRVALENKSEATLDYWLFTGDVEHPQLGP